MRRLVVSAVGLMGLGIGLACVEDRPPSPLPTDVLTRSASVLRVGYSPLEPEIFGPADNVQGFVPELLQTLLAPLGQTAQYTRCEPRECLEALVAGHLDVVPNVPISEADRGLRFGHEAMSLSLSAIFNHREGLPLRDLRQLDGRRLAAVEGSREVFHFTSLAEERGWALEVLTRTTMADVLAAIRDGEADFGVVTQAFGLRHAETYRVTATPHTLHPTPLYLAFRPDLDIESIEHLNTHLAWLKSERDSLYDELHRRWHPPQQTTHLYLDTKLALALIAALIVTSIVALVYRQRARGASSSLLESRLRIASVAEAVGLGVWEYDRAANNVRWDSSMFRLYGRDPGLPSPRLTDWQEAIHPEDRDRVVDEAKKALEINGPFQNEFRVQRPDGTTRAIRNVGHVVASGERSTVVVGINLDITEFRQLERRLQQAEKMEAIGNLTGGIAHDFNNRLMVIRNNLAMSIEDEADEELKSMLRDALGAADACAALTARLLAFARQRDMSSRPTDLNRTVRRSARLLRRTLPATIRIEIDSPETRMWSEVDETLLENALINLSINARDAVASGGRIIFRTLERAGNPPTNVIRVEDNGRGMSRETMARAFEPFFTTKPVGQGTGLGLAMVHGFVHQSGGEVTLESEEGAGTVVELSFAAVDAPAQADETATGDLPDDPKVRRALVCEDDEDVQVMLRRLFKALGIRHQVVGTGDEALALFERDPAFDVVLSDVVMPGATDGVELAHRLRADHPFLPVILMSGYARPSGDPERQPPEGIVWLRKPFTKAHLADAIDSAMSRSETRLGLAERALPESGESEETPDLLRPM
ncbi:MAG: ATP-binding protein [Myxococcota bacterium]